MDNLSLEKYTNAVQAEALSRFVQVQTEETVTVLPNDLRLTDLEKYLPQRRRFRGAMGTTLIPEFVEFSRATVDQAQAMDNLAPDYFPCFVNPEAMTAQIYFNLGDIDDPGHGDHLADLSLKQTSAFQELLKIDGKQFSQREVAEWMEDYVDFLAAETADGKTMPMSAAVSAIRRITIGSTAESTSEESSFGSRRSAMAEVEARNQDKLPAFLTFNCEPYQGLDDRPFRIRLAVITGEEPKISTRIVRLETQQEEMAREFEEKLRTGFEDSPVKTYVGTFSP